MHFRQSISGLLVISLLSSFVPVWGADSPAGQQNQTGSNSKKSEPAKQPAPLVEKYLREGKLQAGETALLGGLKKHGDNDQLRFSLGIVQFLQAIERLSQDLYRYGLRDLTAPGHVDPFLAIPLPVNPEPEVLNYASARQMAETFRQKLSVAEATLAPIRDPDIKLPLHFGMIRLDLKGDAQVDESDSLWKLYAVLTRNHSVSVESAREFYICFDRGDVHWLRGYCHLLMSMCDVYLAHDSSETFDCTAHIFFSKVDSPYGYLTKHKPISRQDFREEFGYISDLIALIHLIRWTVVEPERMTSALHHLEAMVAQGKESWKWIMAETDDDHEWIPNPRQTGVIPNVRVTEQMVNTWLSFLDEADKMLAGKLLIPFWRGDDGRGVNLRRVFLEPRTLDLVLWVQGSAAAPYLEKGELAKEESWDRFQRVFGGEFIGFALWFN